jgi:hypothetical protein
MDEIKKGQKVKTRNQKPEIRMKPQAQNPNGALVPLFWVSGFGHSFGFLVSGFGFHRITGHRNCHAPVQAMFWQSG